MWSTGHDVVAGVGFRGVGVVRTHIRQQRLVKIFKRPREVLRIKLARKVELLRNLPPDELDLADLHDNVGVHVPDLAAVHDAFTVRLATKCCNDQTHTHTRIETKPSERIRKDGKGTRACAQKTRERKKNRYWARWPTGKPRKKMRAYSMPLGLLANRNTAPIANTYNQRFGGG